MLAGMLTRGKHAEGNRRSCWRCNYVVSHCHVGNRVLHVTWPGYSEAEVAKTFTLGMSLRLDLCIWRIKET
jgi:hypothetical protein